MDAQMSLGGWPKAGGWFSAEAIICVAASRGWNLQKVQPGEAQGVAWLLGPEAERECGNWDCVVNRGCFFRLLSLADSRRGFISLGEAAKAAGHSAVWQLVPARGKVPGEQTPDRPHSATPWATHHQRTHTVDDIPSQRSVELLSDMELALAQFNVSSPVTPPAQLSRDDVSRANLAKFLELCPTSPQPAPVADLIYLPGSQASVDILMPSQTPDLETEGQAIQTSSAQEGLMPQVTTPLGGVIAQVEPECAHSPLENPAAQPHFSPVCTSTGQATRTAREFALGAVLQRHSPWNLSPQEQDQAFPLECHFDSGDLRENTGEGGWAALNWVADSLSLSRIPFSDVAQAQGSEGWIKSTHGWFSGNTLAQVARRWGFELTTSPSEWQQLVLKASLVGPLKGPGHWKAVVWDGTCWILKDTDHGVRKASSLHIPNSSDPADSWWFLTLPAHTQKDHESCFTALTEAAKQLGLTPLAFDALIKAQGLFQPRSAKAEDSLTVGAIVEVMRTQWGRRLATIHVSDTISKHNVCLVGPAFSTAQGHWQCLVKHQDGTFTLSDPRWGSPRKYSNLQSSQGDWAGEGLWGFVPLSLPSQTGKGSKERGRPLTPHSRWGHGRGFHPKSKGHPSR